jgi:hypothetical protein
MRSRRALWVVGAAVLALAGMGVTGFVLHNAGGASGPALGASVVASTPAVTATEVHPAAATASAATALPPIPAVSASATTVSLVKPLTHATTTKPNATTAHSAAPGFDGTEDRN